MEDVETVRAERSVSESELKSTNPDMKAVFLQAAANGTLNEPLLSTQSLDRAFGGLQHQVTESITKQEKIIAEVQDLYQPFIQERGSGGAREEALKSIASAYDAFMELKGNLQEGTKFYNDLTQLLVTFQSKVSDFCFARKTEKEELLKDLSSSMASMSVSATPTPPSHHDPTAPGDEVCNNPERPARKADDRPARPPPPVTTAATNPYAGAPATNPYAGTPAANPYAGVPATTQAPNPYAG